MEDQIEDAISTLTPLVEKYRNLKNIEIEFRIGFWDLVGSNINKFNNSVGSVFFDKIKTELESNKLWEQITVNKSEDFFNSCGIRMSRGILNGREYKHYIKKKNHEKVDFTVQGSPFTLRVSISEENPKKENEFHSSIKKLDIQNFTRKKNRISFLHKFWSYDITVTKDSFSIQDKYEIELEIQNICDIPESISSRYLVHSSLMKVKDLLNMCEQIKPCTILIKKV